MPKRNLKKCARLCCLVGIVMTAGVSLGMCSGERIKYPGWDTFEEKSTEVSSEIAKGVADAVVHHVKGADCSSILVTNYLEIPSKSNTSYAAAIYTVPAGYGTCNRYLVWLSKKGFKDGQNFHKIWERDLGGGSMVKGSLESVELLPGELYPCLFVVSSRGGNTQTVYKRIYSLSNGVYLPMPHLIWEYAGDGWGHSTSMGFSKSTVAFEDTDGDGTKEIVLDITEGRLGEWEGVKPEVRKRKLMFGFKNGQYLQADSPLVVESVPVFTLAKCDLQLKLLLDKDVFLSEEPLAGMIVFANTGTQPIRVAAPDVSSGLLSFWIFDESGDKRKYRPVSNTMLAFSKDMGVVIEPGASFSQKIIFRSWVFKRQALGTYKIEAEYKGRFAPHAKSNLVTFKLVEPQGADRDAYQLLKVKEIVPGWSTVWLHPIDEQWKSFEKIISLYPNSTYAKYAQYHYGLGFKSRRKYDRAIAELEKVVDNYPSFVYTDEARYWIAQTCRIKGDMTAAKEAFEQLRLTATSDSMKRKADIHLRTYIKEEK